VKQTIPKLPDPKAVLQVPSLIWPTISTCLGTTVVAMGVSAWNRCAKKKRKINGWNLRIHPWKKGNIIFKTIMAFRVNVKL